MPCKGVPEVRHSAPTLCTIVQCLIAMLLLVCAQAPGADSKEPLRAKSYVDAWDRSKTRIKFAALETRIAELAADDAKDRTKALAELKAQTGLTFQFDAGGPEGRRKQAQRRWERYLTNLRSATQQRIPTLLELPTSRNWTRRRIATAFLGDEAPHPAFLPLLKRMLQNPDEHRMTRVGTLVAISKIPDSGVVEFLIDQLGTDLAYWAWEQLEKLTGANIKTDRKNWGDVKRRYEKWWAENKTTFKYDRERLLIE